MLYAWLRYSVYLLYSYKSTNTDAARRVTEVQWPYMQSQFSKDNPAKCERYRTLDVCRDGADGDLDETGICDNQSADCSIPFSFQGKVYTDCTSILDTSLGGWCVYVCVVYIYIVSGC